MKLIPYDVQRFWERVECGRDDECWMWLGPIANHRPVMSIKTVRGQKMMSATHIALLLTTGVYHTRRPILQTCGFRYCMNPAHLKPSTHKELAAIHCSHRKGENHPAALLTWEQVCTIRAEAARGVAILELARRFHYDPANIRRILKNELWKEPA